METRITLRDLMSVISTLAIVIFVTVYCCKSCGCIATQPCYSCCNCEEHRCPTASASTPIIIRDTVYVKEPMQVKEVKVKPHSEPKVITNILRDTVYFYSKDTLYLYYKCACRDSIGAKSAPKAVQTPEDNAQKIVQTPFDEEKRSEEKPNKNRWSVYGGTGVVAHDILPDKYTDSHYKFSYSAMVGASYNVTDRFRVSGTLDYTAPEQWLYNPQYVGIEITPEYDTLNKGGNHIYLSGGIGYSHSYNIRTINNTVSKDSNSTRIDTDNGYIPLKAYYEKDLGDNWDIGIYGKCRLNVIRQDASNKYIGDVGVQARYKF